ncbi:MAG: hypothetical protein AAGA66_18055 [Bacteroidota bacterium]
MKKLSNLLAALAFVSLVIFISCGKDDGGSAPDPLTQQAALLQKTWNVSSVSNGSVDGNVTSEWPDFTLTITNASSAGGTYSVSGVPAGFEVVWPTAIPSWEFQNNDEDFMLRGDGVVMEISDIDNDNLRLEFLITTSQGARTSVIEGNWTFIFTAAN